MFLRKREKPLILIGDDDRLMRTIMTDLLLNEGYDVITAKNGVEVLEQFKLFLPDIVLLDVIMPIKDGLETCSELRELTSEKHTPILMITALDDDESIEKVFMSGADDYIPKPIKEVILKHRIRRVLETERYRKDIEYYASYDILTSVMNRRAFSNRLIEEICRSKREGYSIGIILADIDKFKTINDNFGHNAGDAVLQWFSKKLQLSCREYDFIGRYGGDEFVICLPNTDFNVVEKIAQRAKNNICKDNFCFNKSNINVTSSFGINILNTNSLSNDLSYEDVVNLMISLTDQSLYLAKKRGRNQVC